MTLFQQTDERRLICTGILAAANIHIELIELPTSVMTSCVVASRDLIDLVCIRLVIEKRCRQSATADSGNQNCRRHTYRACKTAGGK
jgi:hypothetical protein